MRILLFLILLIPLELRADCDTGEVGDLTLAKPVIKLTPIYPRRQLRKGVEGCVVLGFSLAAMANDEGGTVPAQVRVISSTENGRKAFEKAAKKALSKWMFLARNSPPTETISHYATFPFELEK